MEQHLRVGGPYRQAQRNRAEAGAAPRGGHKYTQAASDPADAAHDDQRETLPQPRWHHGQVIGRENEMQQAGHHEKQGQRPGRPSLLHASMTILTSLATVFMLRLVPALAAAMRNLESAMPLP